MYVFYVCTLEGGTGVISVWGCILERGTYVMIV